eukprot:SAG31_NODE_10471_length_1134_cov_1.502415_1_plen_291_part_01
MLLPTAPATTRAMLEATSGFEEVTPHLAAQPPPPAAPPMMAMPGAAQQPPPPTMMPPPPAGVQTPPGSGSASRKPRRAAYADPTAGGYNYGAGSVPPPAALQPAGGMPPMPPAPAPGSTSGGARPWDATPADFGFQGSPMPAAPPASGGAKPWDAQPSEFGFSQAPDEGTGGSAGTQPNLFGLQMPQWVFGGAGGESSATSQTDPNANTDANLFGMKLPGPPVLQLPPCMLLVVLKAFLLQAGCLETIPQAGQRQLQPVRSPNRTHRFHHHGRINHHRSNPQDQLAATRSI